MKKILIIIFISSLTSCSTEDNTQETNSFFNLEIGNLWVYKTFNTYDEINFTASNRIDSIRIVGDTTIAGINYAIRQYNSGLEIENDYIREDANGHLVNHLGHVIHPGTDMDYIGVGNVLNVGTITYQLQEPIAVNIEEEDYYVYPYVGLYVPFDSSFANKTVFSYYQQGLGLVCVRYTFVGGPGGFEERLIYTNIE